MGVYARKVYSGIYPTAPSPVVVGGLEAWYEAFNTESYPGSGTTLTDLSGNGNDATLTGGVTFGTYNGVDSFDLPGNTSDSIYRSGISMNRDWSIQMWIYNDIGTDYKFFGHGTTSANQGLHVKLISSRNVLVGMFANDKEFQAGSNWNSKWWLASFTYDHSTGVVKAYRTKTETTQVVGGSTPYGNTGANLLRFGNQYSSGVNQSTNGRIAAIYMYNRVLTQNEIDFNYDNNISTFSS